MELSYILNQLGEERENYFNAVSPPIIQSSNFCAKSVADLRKILSNEYETPFYTRGYNPTVGILRKKIAALEGAEDALVFSSGTAAMAAAIMSVAKAGDHVVCVKKPYSWTNALLNNYLVKYGVSTTMVDGTETKNFENAIQENTKLIYLESPNSLTFELQDIEAIAKLAKQKNITTIIDNSYSSPLQQSPIKMGIDLIVHSASKYLSGHSDVVAGVVCGSSARIKKMFGEEFMNIGGIISPHDAWLMIRGLRTLEIRINRVSESAAQVVEFLENHPKIEKINYPFSKNNPQLALAKKQMKSATGLFSIQIKAKDISQIDAFCDNLKHFLMATSWGGYESLVFPIGALPQAKNSGLPFNLVRIYIGLENPEILISDIKQALEKV
ncbi:MAG TPA: aminotransferase class I/II-fold pyridoxal phosphate-dependent enzyme [Bacteroidia bacterium]|nr:aminotransferase class I/II-fold pyridoxal phosphate-dependent enzyme [Bacteroidia bacterium]